MEIDYCDNGSSYDGIYTDNQTPLVEGESEGGMRFTANDSFKGIITSTPTGVEENAPAAFSVAQNVDMNSSPFGWMILDKYRKFKYQWKENILTL